MLYDASLIPSPTPPTSPYLPSYSHHLHVSDLAERACRLATKCSHRVVLHSVRARKRAHFVPRAGIIS